MTYYKIQKYLIEHGLSVGCANYVRNMIRELVNEDKRKALKPSRSRAQRSRRQVEAEWGTFSHRP